MNELALFWQRAFFVVLVTLIHLSTSGEISILTDCTHTQQKGQIAEFDKMWSIRPRFVDKDHDFAFFAFVFGV